MPPPMLVLLRLVAALALLIAATSAGRTNGDTPRVHFRSALETEYEDCLARIARARNVCIIAEPCLTGAAGQADKTVDLGQGDPASDAFLKSFATKFRCDLWFSDSGNLLVRRRNEADVIPSTTCDEIIAGLQRLQKLADAYVERRSDSLLAADLTALVLERPVPGLERGVKVSELPEEYQALALRFARAHSLSRFDGPRRLLQHLQKCRSGAAYFAEGVYYGALYPRYTGPFSLVDAALRDVVLGKWVYTQPGGGTMFDGDGEASLENGRIRSTRPDLTTPAEPLTATISSPCTSLDAIYARCPAAVRERLFLDPAVRSHAIVLLGRERSRDTDLFHDIAEVLLLYRETIGDQTHLKLFDTGHQPPLDAFRRNVLRSLPLRYWKRLGIDGRIDAPIDMKRRAEIRKASQALYIDSVRRLRSIAQDEIRKAENGKLPLAKDDTEMLDLIALSSLATATDDTLSLFNGASAYLYDPQQFRDSVVALEVNRTEAKDGEPAKNTLRFAIRLDGGAWIDIRIILPAIPR